jgi:protease-4
MKPTRFRSFFAAFSALAALVGLAGSALAEPPLSAGVPTPGRALASDDDATAIAKNPATLAFLPGAELRWTYVHTGATSADPGRGHALDAATPIGPFATGLRLDWVDPPENAPAPFDESYRWVRWAMALNAKDAASLGVTLGWSSSESAALDDAFSLTAGLAVRPFPFLSLAAVARDLNEPEPRTRQPSPRSYELGLALRPINGRRGFELGLETALDADGVWTPRGTLGLDIPRIGRLRGELSVQDPEDEANVLAMAGLDIAMGSFEASGGGIFGDALTRSGTGFYAGAALHDYRTPGVELPAKVIRIDIDATPGVRGHTRLLRKLWKLAQDPEVAGVLFVLRAEPASSMAHGEEMGDAIRALRAAGKKVICHLEDAAGPSLFVCSQADRTVMNPAGGLRFSGLSSRYFYFGGVLDRLGVRSDFVRIGAHKLAAEQFTLSQGTDVASKDHQAMVEAYERILLHDVAGGRRIPVKELEKRLEKGPFLAKEARDANLIDGLAYEDELDRVVEEVVGEGVKVTKDERSPKAPERWGNLPKVALVYLAGDMMDGESQSVPFLGIRIAGSRTIADALRRAREDKTVRSVVLRIESGGGSSLAADVILREAILTAEKKPLIVSMGTSAASGGYYAAVAGHTIFANRSTLTGSIGIFYGKVDVSGLLGKLGVGSDAFRSSPRADAESLFRPFTDEERAELGSKVKQFYDLFIARVAEGRKMKPEEVDAVARGKVWLGTEALPLGLVDAMGGLRLALTEARIRGGLSADSPILELPEESDSLLDLVLDLAGSPSSSTSPLALPPALLPTARALAPLFLFGSDQPMAHVEWFEDGVFATTGGSIGP